MPDQRGALRAAFAAKRNERAALAARERGLSSPSSFLFPSPVPAGRRLVCGFSWLQRINKDAVADLWFPQSLHRPVVERLRAGDASVLEAFQVEWAALREFELYQDAGNLAIQDLEVTDLVHNFSRLVRDRSKMRGGGYRVTVITMGNFTNPQAEDDDLWRLDRRLQDEITRLVHMVWMQEFSADATALCHEALRTDGWSCLEALPHVAMTLNSMALFGKSVASPHRPHTSLMGHFFRLMESIPPATIQHDVAAGLALPQAAKSHIWVYLAQDEHKHGALQTALTNVFRPFDFVSLGALQGRPDAPSEVMYPRALQGFGQRGTALDRDAYRHLAVIARPH